MAFATAPVNANAGTQLYALLRAWVIATGGMMFSAMGSFLILRRILAHLHGQWAALQHIKGDRRFRAMQSAVRERGTVMAVLARFCPLPYCYTNLLLASLDTVSPAMYGISTFVTAPRLLLPLFMGAKMYELSDRDTREAMDSQAKRINVIFIAVSLGLAVGASWTIWRETSKALQLEDPLLGEDPVSAYGEHVQDERITS